MPKLKNVKNKKLKNATGKRQIVRYRDRKGRLVSPKDVIKGRKQVTWEIWRYSEGAGNCVKIPFGRKWQPSFRKRKRLVSKKELLLAAKKRYGRHKIEVKMIDGEVYAYTRSA